MASTSSLLKSAEATRKRIRQLEDNEVAFEWQLSAKTYEDYQAYAAYIRERLKETENDPAESLSYRKTLNSARTGYVSNEIQRQSIDVLEGRATNTQKRDRMIDLYYMAVDEGNIDQAQSLRLQIDNLDLRIQSEAEAAQSLAEKMARLNAKSIDDAVDQIKGYQEELNNLFKEKGLEQFTREMGAYAEELGVEAGDFFGMQLRLAQEINSIYDNALVSDTDPDNQRKYAKAKNAFNDGDTIPLPSTGGKTIKVSYQDLVDQADAARTGQTVFRTVQTSDGTVFERNKETGFTWGRDENGNYRAITIYKPKTDYTSNAYRTRIDSKGNTIYLDSRGTEVAIRGKDGNVRGLNGKTIKDAARRDYKDLLKQNGFNVISDGGDYIEIANTGDIPGVASETVRLYVNRDGKLQVAGENDQLFNLGFDENTGEFRGIRRDSPNPITFLNDNFSQEFLSKLDSNRLPAGGFAIVDQPLANSQLLRAGEFTRADIANRQQLEQLERARVDAAKREQATAMQALQPTINPQLAPAPTIQAPAASAQRLQPTAQAPLQAPSTAQMLQGNQPGRPQQSLTVQKPRRTPTIKVGR